MSAKIFSRDTAQGKIKKLRRMKRPLALQLVQQAPRNPVVRALARRSASSAAGKHIRSQGAHRRAEKMALQKVVHALGGED